MLKRFITTIALTTVMLFATSIEAQSRVVVKRNGKTYIVVTAPHSRYETPRRHRAPRHRHHTHCYVRPNFRYWRHIHRFYHQKTHARHRCTYCIRYQRWLNWRPCRYNPVIHVCR